VDEMDEVSYQHVVEDFLNNQWAPSKNCVSEELSMPLFAAEHIADLKFNVYSIPVI